MKRFEELVRQRARESCQSAEEFIKASGTVVVQAASELVRVVRGGGKILVAGNGGSAADAQHFAAELVNRFLMERRPLPAVALTTDTSILTSIANDYSYEDVFSKQVQALGREGDALVVLSTSCRSPNILRALERANAASMLTIGLGGKDGGAMAPLCDICLLAPSDNTPRIQEIHHLALHLISEIIEIQIFAS